MIAVLALVFVGFLALAGCGTPASSDNEATNAATPDEAQGDQTTEAPTSEGETLYDPSYVPNGAETAVIKTTAGDITVKLYGKDAPIHVGNFVELARKGFYDDTKFHRYVPGFVVQGGDPGTTAASAADVRAEAAKGDGSGRFGTGGPGYYIKGEFDPSVNPNKHVEGALGMARAQSPDSAGSQFYFALQPLPQLDGGYTVFGVVTDGMDVVKALRAGDAIESVEILGAAE
jgi:peptidyl-prolyl cis-trans isomerase B (cyclophilin B)